MICQGKVRLFNDIITWKNYINYLTKLYLNYFSVDPITKYCGDIKRMNTKKTYRTGRLG